MIKRILILSFLFILFLAGQKANAQYYNSFKTNSTAGIVLGGDAKLTSGDEDPVNNGFLRLTPSQVNRKGFAYINTPFPSTQGIKVEFEYFTWGGNLADGITFFLFDGTSAFEIGQYGGALGYAQNNNNGTGLGMKNGVLALGLDEYGNFGVASETKNGGFRDFNGQVYTSNINANGLVTVRGGVGPNGEREGPTAYPFLGGKITSGVFGGTAQPLASDILPAADWFGIATDGRAPNQTDGGYRKVRLDIQRTGTGFIINLEVFVGSKARWIPVLTNFIYTVASVPSTFKAGFSASTGSQTNNHEIRNVRITPSASNLLNPEAVLDTKSTVLNTPTSYAVLGNDNAAKNFSGIFQPGTLDLDPSTLLIDNTKTVAGKGTFTVDDAGLVTFTPLTGFTGSAAVDYNFQDNYGMTSNTVTYTVTVNAGNTSPAVSNFVKNGIEDTAVPFTAANFTSNYTDPETDPLNKVKIITLPSNGTLKLNNINITVNQEIPFAQLDNITFVPNPNWNGSTTFNWNGYDGTSYALLNATVTINISAVNDLPAVTTFSKNGPEDTALPFTSSDFTTNFSDPDSDPLNKIKIVSLPSNGTLKLNGTNITVNQEIPLAQLGNINFIPDANWNGNTAFDWNGNDGTGYAVSSAGALITIAGVNDLPIVAGFSKNGTEDTAVPFTSSNFTSNFTDPDSDPLNKVKIISLPANGTLKVNGTTILINQEIPLAQLDNITFVPNPNWNGSTTFDWNGNDGTSYATLNATITINISAVNDLPTVAAFSKSGTEDTAVPFTAADFTTNFIDPDSDPLNKVKIISLPANGTLKLSGTNIILNQEIPLAQLPNITFAPNANWNGSTTFDWNGNDGTSYATLNATITITITAVNDLPIVAAFTKNGTEDNPVPFSAADFTANFTDPDSDPLNKVKIATLPANGTLKLNGTSITVNQEIPFAQLGNITFVPNANWNGSTTFDWNGYDGTAYAQNPAQITINISSVIDPPVALDDSTSTDMNKPVDIVVLTNDTADGSLDNTSVTILAPPLHGEVQISSTGVITYKPNAKYIGPDIFTYKVKDGNGNWSNPATVSIDVKGFQMTNIFTPNGDGKNDTFVILGLELYDVGDLTVFNRWGNEVYRNSKYDNSWEGTGLNAGTYFFIVKLKKGSNVDVRKGWVLLKR